MDTGVNFGPGDGKGTFIDSTGTMYIWRDGNDSSIFFLPGNDTVTDEGWIITATAVAIVTAGKSIGINKVVKAGSTVSSISIDPNKINHIFNKSQHKLGPLLDKFGNNATKTYIAVQEAAQKVVDTNNLTGTYSSTKNPIIVNIKNFNVYVGGKVENGIFTIGTFFIK